MHVMRIQLKLRVLGRVLSSLFRSKIYQLSSSRPLHTLPSLTLHTPHTLTQCHSYSQRASQEAIVCWKCQRKLDSLSGDEIPRVQFFCPCDKEVVLPPSKQHTYFEIMNWYVHSTFTLALSPTSHLPLPPSPPLFCLWIQSHDLHSGYRVTEEHIQTASEAAPP